MNDNMKIFNVLVVRAVEGDLRLFRIAAESFVNANELASAAVARLSPERIRAISVSGIDHGAAMAPVVIIDVVESEYDNLPVPAFTREELMCSDLEFLIERNRSAGTVEQD